jgi:3-deoxy-D-manno-octulosonic-acid transferase
MIYLIYDIMLFLATPLIFAYSMIRSRRKGRRREGTSERLGMYDARLVAALNEQKTVWVHAVSVGETMAVKPLLKALKESIPGIRIVLSNVTETGRSIAEKTAGIDHCIYFPLDYRFTVKRALATVRPALLVIVETEIWPNFLRAARDMGIPAVLVNGRISDRSFGRYLALKWFFRPVLANLSAFCMQTTEDARRIIAIGADPERVHVTRNLKYDIPVTPPSPEKKRALHEGYKIPDGIMVITAGSTHAGEEETLVSVYRRLLAGGRECFLVLAPRHPERGGEVAEIIRNCGMPFTLRSALDRREGLFRPGEVLLVDTVGELMRFYAISDLVFVGGSLAATGGHNILEPASLGVPVLFGPHMHNFRETASLLLACGGGFQVEDGEELTAVLQILLDDETKRRETGQNGMKLLLENSGATEMQMVVIRKLMKGEE